MNLPSEVSIVEVGPRDGLQNIQQFLDTEKKIELIKLLAKSGLKRIEATSFVHPKAVPQFKDAKDIIAGIGDIEGIEISALVPNLVGARNALESGVKELVFVFSVSESHNKSNVNRTCEESIDELVKILAHKDDYPDAKVRINLACVFGCPFEGEIKDEEILEYVSIINDLGLVKITLSDTVGYGNPEQVRRIVRSCIDRCPSISFGVHFHNTRGLGLANALACLEEGIAVIDSSAGGLGGCPFVPGATGNISTEELVFMLGGMGIKTNVDMESLFEATRFIENNLPDARLSSNVFRAGLPGKGAACAEK